MEDLLKYQQARIEALEKEVNRLKVILKAKGVEL